MNNGRISVTEALDTLNAILGYKWTWVNTGGGNYALHGDQTALPWNPNSTGYALLGPYDWTDERYGIAKNAPILMGIYDGEDNEPLMMQTYASWDEMVADATKQVERVR